jgi:hypothetical protein
MKCVKTKSLVLSEGMKINILLIHFLFRMVCIEEMLYRHCLWTFLYNTA